MATTRAPAPATPDALLLLRRELRKLAGSLDVSHQTHPERPVLTGLMRREGRKTPVHRTLSTGLTPVRPMHSASSGQTRQYTGS